MNSLPQILHTISYLALPLMLAIVLHEYAHGWVADHFGVLWSMDVGWRLVTGHHLVGGTEYMWDASYPLGVRLQSTFHLVLPLVLLSAMRKLGYERRALTLQAAIAGGVLIVSRFLPAALNMNYAYADPLFHRAWGPAPVHLAVIFAGMVGVLYWPIHLLFSRMYPTPKEAI
jgi:hypothetical protein